MCVKRNSAFGNASNATPPIGLAIVIFPQSASPVRDQSLVAVRYAV